MRLSNSFSEAEVRLLEQMLGGACQVRKDLTQLTRSRAYSSVRAKVQRMRQVIDGAELADARLDGERGQGASNSTRRHVHPMTSLAVLRSTGEPSKPSAWSRLAKGIKRRARALGLAVSDDRKADGHITAPDDGKTSGV